MKVNLDNLLIDGRIALGVFDFDGNILQSQTPWYVIELATGNEVAIPCSIIDQNPDLIKGPNAKYRLHDNPEDSFAHFRDYSDRKNHQGSDHLLKDVREAVANGRFAPSFHAFKDVFLVKARIFAIITARGHSAENLERAMMQINEATLTDAEKAEQLQNIESLWRQRHPGMTAPKKRSILLQFYFSEVAMYYGVASPHLSRYLHMEGQRSNEKKTVAMSHFIEYGKRFITKNFPHLDGRPFTIGFSDDGIENTRSMYEFFQREKEQGTLIGKDDKLRIYYTAPEQALEVIEKEYQNTERRNNMTVIRI